MATEQGTVTSQDGATIAYELSGQGPVIVLVAAALSDRSDTTKLAKLLSANFTVINYDRRGRGKSADTKPYSPQREIEDIAALIAAGGGSAALFGSSSGAVLCLDAATSMDNTVTKVALFEPPLILDDSRPPVGDAFTQAVTEALNAGNASKAVKLFMGKALGVPAFGVIMMRFMPGWSKMVAMAATLPYDLNIVSGIQDGKPLPTDRWKVNVPTLILTGQKSEQFFHTGAAALAALLSDATHKILPGVHHGSVVMSPKSVGEELTAFFKS
ncbi:alpha/beta fold hydrolase [Antrihabitans spumae]